MWLLIALVLLVVWAVGFLVFHVGAIIHIALVAAIVFFVWHWMSNRTSAK